MYFVNLGISLIMATAEIKKLYFCELKLQSFRQIRQPIIIITNPLNGLVQFSSSFTVFYGTTILKDDAQSFIA